MRTPMESPVRGVNKIHAAGGEEVGVPRTAEVANKRLRKFRDDDRGD